MRWRASPGRHGANWLRVVHQVRQVRQVRYTFDRVFFIGNELAHDATFVLHFG